MDNTTDLLQIKIEKAKAQLPAETLKAIAAVPWQAAILQMRETKGYSFEQLGDLEIETELLLCGLLSPENYSKELENRMRLSKTEVNELIKEMNNLVFSKIKEELVKMTEKKNVPQNSPLEEYSALKAEGGGISTPSSKPATPQEGNEKTNAQILKSAGIEIVPEKLELNSPLEEYPSGGGGISTPSRERATPQEGNVPPILVQKLSGYVKNEVVETKHSLENITKTNTPTPPSATTSKPTMDPYREIPE